jgi:hypothetical protein
MDYPGKVITKTQVTPTQISATGVWTLDDAAAAVKNNNWPVAGVPNPISKSLRFNSADTAYLNRTLTTPTNNKIFTFSTWVKRSALGANQEIFMAYVAGVSFDNFRFNSSDQLSYFDNTAGYLTTSAVYRDVGAWYHVMVAVDTTQATSSNRVKLYVNGVQITAFSATAYPSQNQAIIFNSAVIHNIGRFGYSANAYFSGYMTEINFIDGQALTPSDFGLTNPQTGQWIPKKYTGTYGTNGFYLNFKDATSTTTLGYDYSGNANNWTTNNFSVTAGSGNDSLTDVPTPWVAYNTTGDVGGVFRGNYATYNSAGSAPSVTLTNGNLDASHGAFSSTTGAASTFGVSSGKWYWEVTINAISSGAPYIGIVRSDQLYPFTTLFANNSQGYAYRSTGVKRNNGSDTAYGASYTSGDVIGVALDMDAGTIVFYKNNTSQGTAFSSLSGTFIPIDANGTSGGTYTSTINFGQRPFAYTPPAGFRSLCTTNLPATTIGFGLTNQANSYMDVSLWTGDNTTPKAVVTNLNFAPDFLWLKQRSAVNYHFLQNRVIGSTLYLASNATDAEASGSSGGWIQSLDNNGFTTVTGSSNSNNVNGSGITYVGWSWKAGGTGVTNTSGTITSTVSANTTAGFSIVTYTGNGTNGATVGHGLGIAPSLIFIKNRGAVASWLVYSSSIGASNFLVLNTTDASAASALPFNNTAPTSSVFSLGTSGGTNTNGGTFVAYCFAAVPGYSAFGSYTGNGSTDGPFVYTGFRPKFILGKRSDAANGWFMFDGVRNDFNVADDYLAANASAAEATFVYGDFLSNGFKLRATTGDWNGSGGTIIYAAFAESPFQFANAR